MGGEGREAGEPQKSEWSQELQAKAIGGLANEARSRFTQGEADVENGSILTDRLIWSVMDQMKNDIATVASHITSPEALTHLRARIGLADEHPADAKSLIVGYIKFKLQPQIDELRNKEKVRQEQDTPIKDRIAAANAFEPAQITVDLKANLASRPDQHEILRGGILKGVYPGTERTPTILIDDAQDRGPELDQAFTKFHDEVNRLVERSQPVNDRARAQMLEAYAKETAIKHAKEALPTDTSAAKSQWAGKKIALQLMMQERIGSPSAQSLLAAYLLDRAQREQMISPRSAVMVYRGINEQGAHAYLKMAREIIDPSVSSEPMHDRFHSPDPFYQA